MKIHKGSTSIIDTLTICRSPVDKRTYQDGATERASKAGWPFQSATSASSVNPRSGRHQTEQAKTYPKHQHHVGEEQRLQHFPVDRAAVGIQLIIGYGPCVPMVSRTILSIHFHNVHM